MAMKLKNKITSIKISNHKASTQDDFDVDIYKKFNDKLNNNINENNENEAINSRLIIKNFFDAVSNKTDIEQASKLQSLTKMVSSVVELEKDGVLDKKEANLLVEFVVGKFVESKFDKIVDHLQLGNDSNWRIAYSKLNIYK